ncbi:hypothetical protein BHE74_00035254 [Ensete ventricosum]|nr:hypothetical protein BHE74_00035254 [Ensete ventricosum]
MGPGYILRWSLRRLKRTVSLRRKPRELLYISLWWLSSQAKHTHTLLPSSNGGDPVPRGGDPSSHGIRLGATSDLKRSGGVGTAMADGGDGKTAAAAGDGGEKKRQEQSAAFHELFTFADRWDCLLMAAGSVGAVVHGSAMPVFFLLFGDLVNGFGKNQTHLSVMTHEVSKVRLTVSPAFPI